MNQLAKAISIAANAFVNKTDRAGRPYILHCLKVMRDLHSNDDELNSIAVLHDLLEDCEDWNMSRLVAEGFSDRVIEGIIILTHKKGDPYDEYIKDIAHNPDAVLVKKADLRHNSNITRLKGLTKKDFDRIEKYHRAYVYLSNI